jgi:hypothetical protein
MIFKTYNSEQVARVFFDGYFFWGLFLSVISLYGFVSGAGMFATITGVLYLVIVSLLSRNKKFRGNNFAVLLCLFTLLFLNIPAAFMFFKGTDYLFGEGLASLPFEQSDYWQSLPYGFLYLSVLWTAIWFGIISAGTKKQKVSQKNFSSCRLGYLLLLGAIVAIVTWLDNHRILQVRMGNAERENSLLAFLFFDHAYLVMVGVILFFKLNEPGQVVNQRRITALGLIIFLTFTLISFNAGSKGAILAIFIMFMIFPFAASREYPHVKVVFPSIKFLAMLLLLSPLLFYFALLQRISVKLGSLLDFRSFLASISWISSSELSDIFNDIFSRLSMGGMDRYLLIFQSFFVNAFDPNTAWKLVGYLSKNALNMVLLGTPFPQAYVPSSQLFVQVINKDLVGQMISAESLIRHSNTQPYTVFGIFMIIFGYAAPLLLYICTVAYVYMYNRMNNIFLKTTMLYFFFGALASYGIEIVFGNSVHLLASMLFMYLVIEIFSQLHRGVAGVVRCDRQTNDESPDKFRPMVVIK